MGERYDLAVLSCVVGLVVFFLVRWVLLSLQVNEWVAWFVALVLFLSVAAFGIARAEARDE